MIITVVHVHVHVECNCNLSNCKLINPKNPVEVPKFWGLICNCLNCNFHCNDHIFIYICISTASSRHLHSKYLNVQYPVFWQFDCNV